MAENAVNYKMVIIGGSAGSLEAILKIIPVLPLDSGATFIVVVHRKNDAESILTELLANRTTMRVKEVEDKDPIVPNALYLAPSDYHVLIERTDLFSLDSSEKVHHSRPSIDVCFESVAAMFGPSVIGVLLSGANADGAKGLSEIKLMGGLTIVQDPNAAEVGFMPQQAMDLFPVDFILPPDEIGPKLRELLNGK